jgi:WD40 repeat protein
MSAHQGAITSLNFTPEGRLISAGRDNVVKVWAIEGHGRVVGVHPGRTGEVANLGISPDGRRVLLDMGEELRILDPERGTRVGSLQNQKQGRFQSFARFSPSGKLLFTSASNSRLQLWRAPATAEETQFFRQGYTSGFDRSSLFALRLVGSGSGWSGPSIAAPMPSTPKLWPLSGQEIRHFVVPGGANVNCGTFARDESVVFTGGTDKAVRAWAVPSTEEWSQPLEARITYVGNHVERGTDMVRIRAEMDNPANPDLRLQAGLFAVMRLFPETSALK